MSAEWIFQVFFNLVSEFWGRIQELCPRKVGFFSMGLNTIGSHGSQTFKFGWEYHQLSWASMLQMAYHEMSWLHKHILLLKILYLRTLSAYKNHA